MPELKKGKRETEVKAQPKATKAEQASAMEAKPTTEEPTTSAMEATQTLPNHLSTGLKMVQTPVMTREERRAALMRYLRARTPNKSTRKANEAKKMPESIKQQIEKDDRKKSYYFDMWLSCGKDWGGGAGCAI